LYGLLSNQLYVFLIYCLCGIMIGVFFDIFRILRKSFKTPDIITYLQDIMFWCLTGLFLLYVIFKFNNGEIRSYIFIGIGLGVLFYLFIFSKVFIKINVVIIKYIKLVLGKIISFLIFPIKILKNIFNKIIIENVKKLNNIIIFYVKKCKKDKKLQKNKKEKKDFGKICRK